MKGGRLLMADLFQQLQGRRSSKRVCACVWWQTGPNVHCCDVGEGLLRRLAYLLQGAPAKC